jgi:hypothetical protein
LALSEIKTIPRKGKELLTFLKFNATWCYCGVLRENCFQDFQAAAPSSRAVTGPFRRLNCRTPYIHQDSKSNPTEVYNQWASSLALSDYLYNDPYFPSHRIYVDAMRLAFFRHEDCDVHTETYLSVLCPLKLFSYFSCYLILFLCYWFQICVQCWSKFWSPTNVY